jgi:hypothetical protein
MKTTILNLTVAIFIAASLQTHAQSFVYDQQSATSPASPIGNGNVDGIDIQPNPLTQSFMPTLSAIGFVQFEFEDVPNNGNSGATVYVNLWTGSPNIHSATLLGSTTPVYMPNGFVSDNLFVAGVTNFYFSTSIALTVGQTYYLQPVVLSGDNPWDIVTIGNTYPNGQLFANGLPGQPSTDLWFREGVVVPEPTTLALFGLAGLLIVTRRHFRRCLFIIGLFTATFVHAQTYYLESLIGSGSPPFPMNPYGNAVPVQEISPGIFLVEDASPIGGRRSQAMSYSSPPSPGDNGTNNDYQPDGGGYTPLIFTNGLWLEVLNQPPNPGPTNLWRGCMERLKATGKMKFRNREPNHALLHREPWQSSKGNLRKEIPSRVQHD